MSLTFPEILILMLIAAVCGAVGQVLAGFSRGGLLVSIALGFIGALFGTWLARSMELPEPFALRVGEASFPVVWSIIGSAIVLVVLNLIQRPLSSDL